MKSQDVLKIYFLHTDCVQIFVGGWMVGIYGKIFFLFMINYKLTSNTLYLKNQSNNNVTNILIAFKMLLQSASLKNQRGMGFSYIH